MLIRRGLNPSPWGIRVRVKMLIRRGLNPSPWGLGLGLRLGLGLGFRVRVRVRVPFIGESLFILFASLTYAYHYLMTLIK